MRLSFGSSQPSICSVTIITIVRRNVSSIGCRPFNICFGSSSRLRPRRNHLQAAASYLVSPHASLILPFAKMPCALAAFRDATLTLGSISTAGWLCIRPYRKHIVHRSGQGRGRTPQLSRPREGYLIPTVELPAICSPSSRLELPEKKLRCSQVDSWRFSTAPTRLTENSFVHRRVKAACCLYH